MLNFLLFKTHIEITRIIKLLTGTTIDIVVTNRPTILHLVESARKDCQKMTVSFFRAYFKRILSKIVEYRNYKQINQQQFTRALNKELR